MGGCTTSGNNGEYTVSVVDIGGLVLTFTTCPTGVFTEAGSGAQTVTCRQIDPLNTLVLVTPPPNCPAGVTVTGALNTAGTLVTLNIVNNSGGAYDINGLYFQIMIVGY